MEPRPSTEHAARHEIYDELDWKQSSDVKTPDVLEATGDSLPPRRAINLNENTSLGSHAQHQPHYHTYCAYKGGELQPDLEALVYLIDSLATEEVSPKERKHRLRCIKRLAGRVILRADVPKFQIVVFAVDAADDDIEASVEAPKKALRVLDTIANRKTNHEPGGQKKGAQDSSHQRISAQGRQRDRRQAARKAKREQAVSTQAADQDRGVGDQEDDDGDITVDASGYTIHFKMLLVI
jgi:hypothetical protein